MSNIFPLDEMRGKELSERNDGPITFDRSITGGGFIMKPFKLFFLLSIVCLISFEAQARDFFSCGENASQIGLGLEFGRADPAFGTLLNGSSLLVIPEVGLPCGAIGIEGRLAFSTSDQSNKFGHGLDPFLVLNGHLLELVDVEAGYRYINFSPVNSSNPNDQGTGDIHEFSSLVSYPFSFYRFGDHTVTPSVGGNCYWPEGWEPLLDAQNGCQLRGGLFYDWETPEGKVHVFTYTGFIYSPNRLLIFEEGITGAFDLGVRVEVTKFLAISLTASMWVQQEGKLDGPPVIRIPTPFGEIVIDKREGRDRFSGRGQLLFEIPFKGF